MIPSWILDIFAAAMLYMFSMGASANWTTSKGPFIPGCRPTVTGTTCIVTFGDSAAPARYMS
jgi:hypothetical protein